MARWLHCWAGWLGDRVEKSLTYGCLESSSVCRGMFCVSRERFCVSGEQFCVLGATLSVLGSLLCVRGALLCVQGALLCVRGTVLRVQGTILRVRDQFCVSRKGPREGYSCSEPPTTLRAGASREGKGRVPLPLVAVDRRNREWLGGTEAQSQPSTRHEARGLGGYLCVSIRSVHLLPFCHVHTFIP